jgi:hypothetical protein
MNNLTNIPYRVYSIKEHKKIKNSLLKIIENDPLGETAFNISRVDFYRRQNTPGGDNPSNSEYMQKLLPVIQPSVDKFVRKFSHDSEINFKHYDIVNFWYQQYTHMQKHQWHIHGKCDISLVYYLELPNGSSPTVFKDFNGGVVKPDAKEGDLLVFPSFVPHCSPPVLTNTRKSIIAINLTLDESY